MVPEEKKEKKPQVKLKTISFFIKDKRQHKIFTTMSQYSKNIYNSTMFCYKIYKQFKADIYKELYELCKIDTKKIINNDTVEEYLYKIYDKYYKLFSDNCALLKTNNDAIYKFIKEYLNGVLVLSNLDHLKIAVRIALIEQKVVEFNNTNKHFVFDRIIDNILESFYRRNYFKTRNELLKKKHVTDQKITINHPDFIDDVKHGRYVLNDYKYTNWRSKITKDFKIKFLSEMNAIGRITYKHIDNDIDKLPSDVIINIISKAYQGISGHFGKLRKGMKSNPPSYLPKDGVYNLFFFMRSFRIYQEDSIKKNKKIIQNKRTTIKLSVGNYVSEHYNEIIKNDNYVHIKGKKYVLKDNLSKTKPKKKKGYIKVGDKYIHKDNPNIIDTSFINLRLRGNILRVLEKKYEDEKEQKVKKTKKQIKEEKIKEMKKVKLVEIVPIYNGYKFKVNITYEDYLIDEKLDTRRTEVKDAISIDTGTKNLMTIYDPKDTKENKNNTDLADAQKIIRGGQIKSINEYFIKDIADQQSKNKRINKQEKLTKNMKRNWLKRNNKVNNLFNELVKKLYEMYKDKRKVIIGYNDGWKQKVNLGRKNNRIFCSISFRKLINKIFDKFNTYGISVREVEEGYTSKRDSLTLEPLRRLEEGEQYGGKRIKRGLFISGNKKAINADLNGAINILRKYYGERIKKITGKGLYNPRVVKL